MGRFVTNRPIFSRLLDDHALAEVLERAVVVEHPHTGGGRPQHHSALILLRRTGSGLLWRFAPAQLLRDVVLVAPDLANTIFWLAPAGRWEQIRVVDRVARRPCVLELLPCSIVVHHVDGPVAVVSHHKSIVEPLLVSAEALFRRRWTTKLLAHIGVVEPNCAKTVLRLDAA